MSDLTKTFSSLLLAMVKAANPEETGVTEASYSFGAPSADATQAGKNTSLTLTAAAQSGYTGTQILYYNRLSLTAIGATGDLQFDAEGKTRISDAVAEFNTRFRTNLVAGTDYTDGDLPDFDGTPGESKQITVTALGGSHVYLDNVIITLKVATRDLAEVIANNNLDGLTYEPVA